MIGDKYLATAATLSPEPGPFTLRMRVSGLEGFQSVTAIEDAVARIWWVLAVDVSVARGTVTVRHGKPNAYEILCAIENLGFAVDVLDVESAERERIMRSGQPRS